MVSGALEGAGAQAQHGTKAKDAERITSSFMTKYEKARVLGTRAL